MACPDCDHFLAVRVGAYGIRPTEWPRRGQECASKIDHLDHSPHKWDVCEAYSIRPYIETCKRTTFSTSHPIASPKGSLFFVSYLKTCPERGAFFVSHRKTYPERGAFFTCYNRETIQRAAFYVFHRMTCPDMCRVRIYCNRGTIKARCVSRIPRHGMISTRCGWGMRRREMGRGGKISCLVTSEKS